MRKVEVMNVVIKSIVVSLSLFVTSAHAAMTDAEAMAINTGVPRDCSLFVVATKKAECTDFNKALFDCQASGFRAGLELKACMVKKGKVKSR